MVIGSQNGGGHIYSLWGILHRKEERVFVRRRLLLDFLRCRAIPVVLMTMENETLRSRVSQLIQKSRKAVRLYSGMERLRDGEGSEFSSVQLDQWQQVNSDLMRALSAAIDNPNHRMLSTEVFAIRDRFCADWRTAEADLRLKQRDLILVSERGDFVKAALLSRQLVALKAREQAAQAAHHEIEEVIGRTKVSNSEKLNERVEVQPTISPGDNPDGPPPANRPEQGSLVRTAKIIPLRSRQG